VGCVYSVGAGGYGLKSTQWDTVCASKQNRPRLILWMWGQPAEKKEGTALGCPWTMHGAPLTTA